MPWHFRICRQFFAPCTGYITATRVSRLVLSSEMRNDMPYFMNHIAEIAPDPEMLMFDDEAAKDERTLIHKFVHSKNRNKVCFQGNWVPRREKRPSSTSPP